VRAPVIFIAAQLASTMLKNEATAPTTLLGIPDLCLHSVACQDRYDAMTEAKIE